MTRFPIDGTGRLASEREHPTASLTGPAGGDLTGSYPNPTVVPIACDVVSAHPTGVAATDTANLQAFFTAMNAKVGATGWLYSDTPWVINGGVVHQPTAIQPDSLYTNYRIFSDRAVIQAAAGTTGALIGDSVPSDMTALMVRTNRAMHYHGIDWEGDLTAGQVGLQIIGGLKPTTHDCNFFALDTGSDYIFCLLGAEYNCGYTNNKTYGRRVRSATGVVTGATEDNSGSNQFMSFGDRGAAETGMTAQYTYEASDGCVMYSPTTEGGNPVNNIVVDAQSSGVVKQFMIAGSWHVENQPSGASLKLTGTMTGAVTIESCFYQSPHILIDASGQDNNLTIYIEQIPYIPDFPVFKGDADAGAAWYFGPGCFGVDHVDDSVLWSGGVVPVRAAQVTMSVYGYDPITGWVNTGDHQLTIASRNNIGMSGAQLVLACTTTKPLRLGPNVEIGAPSSKTGATLNKSASYLYLDETNHLLHQVITDSAGTSFDFPSRPYNGAGTASTQQGSTTYTFALADVNTVVESTNAGATTFTIPPNASVAFPVGTILRAYSEGAGGITVAAGAGVTLHGTATAAQFGQLAFRQRAANEWVPYS